MSLEIVELVAELARRRRIELAPRGQMMCLKLPATPHLNSY
jgi:hypothetical protein